MGEISSDFGADSSAKLPTKAAWQRYARKRWPFNGVNCAMSEWGLTEGEAKGLFAGQISQPTIDKILDHPRGGFGLGLRILEIRTQTALRSWVQSERERLSDEAEAQAAASAAMAEMASHLPAVLGVGDRRDGRVSAGLARPSRTARR